MTPELVASPRNRRVQEAIKLHRARERAGSGCTLLEGPHLVAEAMRAGARFEHVFATPEDPLAEVARSRGIDVVIVSERVLQRLSTTESPQSPAAVVEIPDPVIPESGHVIVCWGLGDPGNMGTLIRTAAAFGMGFAVGPGCVDPWSPKVLRAAAGGHFRTCVGSVADLSGLGGRLLVATVARGGMPPGRLDAGRDSAVLVGDEAHGLPDEVVAAADVAVTIPMPGGMESLNAAVAGAIVAFALAGHDETGGRSL
jgi:TrmH family RNA methyltransferase